MQLNFDNIPVLPSDLFSEIESTNKNNWNEIKNVNPEGTRNNTSIKVIGKLLYSLPQDQWDTVGLELFKSYNQTHNAPPLDEEELMAKWEGIKRKHLEQPEKKKQSQKEKETDGFLELIENKEKTGEIIYFHNELNESFVKVVVDGNPYIMSTKSKMLKRYILRLFLETTGFIIPKEYLNSLVEMMDTKASFGKNKHELSVRVTKVDNVLFYDLKDEQNRTVKITTEGYEITSPPIIFRQYQHQNKQVEPSFEGDVKLFLKYANIKEKKYEILLLVWIIACFIAGFPHPILYVFGPQGAAKSTLQKLIKDLIDPSSVDLTPLRNDLKEFIQLLAHHWLIVFDNVSSLNEEMSDAMCRAVTGTAFSKRELYTDDEDVIYSFKRCICINGINSVIGRPDLLERSILLELERISPINRRDEHEIITEFQKDKPQILGGVFTALSKALAIKKTIKLSYKPRMSDFASWGCAISEAIGYSKKEFLSALFDNIKAQNEQVLCESPIAQALLFFMEGQNKWHNTSSVLLNELKVIANKLEINEKELPKTSNVLSRQLNKLRANLADIGITVITNKPLKRGRGIYISKTTSINDNIVDIVAEDINCNDVNDNNDTSVISDVNDPYRKYKEDA